MNYKEMTAPCGLNCANCEVYNGYYGKDPRKVKSIIMVIKPFLKVASLFSIKRKITLGMLNRMMKIPSDRPLCKGCRGECGNCLLHESEGLCKIYQCTQEKGIHNCSECEEFPCESLYPSKILADIAPHNTKVTNLCLIKKYGVETWGEKYSKKIQDNYFNGNFPVDL